MREALGDQTQDSKEEMQVGGSSEKAKKDAAQRALTNAPLAQVTLSSGQSAPCPW